MNIQKEIHVNIGEVKIGRIGDVLKTTLGSCVGIAFLWQEKQMCGLAHCLLPEGEVTNHFELCAKYVTQAIPSLISMMKIKDEISKKQIEVYLIGGANMMEQLLRSHSNIGIMNVDCARKLLKEKGFKIKSEETGGNHGRHVVIDCSTYKVQISILNGGELKSEC